MVIEGRLMRIFFFLLWCTVFSVSAFLPSMLLCSKVFVCEVYFILSRNGNVAWKVVGGGIAVIYFLPRISFLLVFKSCVCLLINFPSKFSPNFSSIFKYTFMAHPVRV